MDLQLLQKELKLSPYIQYNICYHLIPRFDSVINTFCCCGWREDVFILLWFCSGMSPCTVLIKFCVGSRCWRTLNGYRGSIRLTRPQPVFLCREVTSGKQPIKETWYETMHLIVLHKSKPFFITQEIIDFSTPFMWNVEKIHMKRGSASLYIVQS